MPEKIRLGIIGLGTMGRTYARLAEQNPDVELVTICDQDAKRLEEAKDEHPQVVGYSEYEQMYAEAKLDAVGIITPDFAHYDPVVKAARAGINLLVEKPLSMEVEEAWRMVTAIRQAGVICQVAYTNRWGPPYVAARNLIQSGQLGEIISMNARLNNTLTTPTEMLRWSSKSSPAWFLMTHALDVARWLSGQEPIEVYAQGVKKKLVALGIDTYDSIQALFRLSSGGSLTLESCWTLPKGMPLIFDFKYEIIGSESTIFVDTHDQGVHLATAERLTHPVSLFIQRYGAYVGHLQAMFDGFVEAVRKQTRPIANEEDGLRATIAIAAVHDSLKSGKPIAIRMER